MKITKSRLKQLIREEIKKLNEWPWMTGGQSDADIEREEHEQETTGLPTGLLDEPRKYLGSGQTAKERADEIYRVKKFAQDIADNIESLVSDPKEYLIDPVLAKVARGVESALDQGITTVEDAKKELKDLLKLLKKPFERRADPRTGGAGDYVAPNYPRIVPGTSNLEEQEDPEMPMSGSQELK